MIVDRDLIKTLNRQQVRIMALEEKLSEEDRDNLSREIQESSNFCYPISHTWDIIRSYEMATDEY